MINAYIFFIVAGLLGLNVILYFMGGYFVLFRTALNTNLRSVPKLWWMLGQTVFPISCFGYLIKFEKNDAIKVITCCTLVLGLAFTWAAVNHVPYGKIWQAYDAIIQRSEI